VIDLPEEPAAFILRKSFRLFTPQNRQFVGKRKNGAGFLYGKR